MKRFRRSMQIHILLLHPKNSPFTIMGLEVYCQQVMLTSIEHDNVL